MCKSQKLVCVTRILIGPQCDACHVGHTEIETQVPERAMATRSTPPSGSRAFRALAPKSFSRKSGPWLLIRAWRKLDVSSTGGRLANGATFWIEEKEEKESDWGGHLAVEITTRSSLRVPNFENGSSYKFSLMFDTKAIHIIWWPYNIIPVTVRLGSEPSMTYFCVLTINIDRENLQQRPKSHFSLQWRASRITLSPHVYKNSILSS